MSGRWLPALLVVLVLTPVAGRADTPPVAVRAPTMTTTDKTATTASGYMVLSNSADHAIALVGAQSPQFETVELRGAVGGPEAAQHVQVPAHGELTLTPGGLHLFLSEPRSPLSRGDMIDLVLSFDNGQMEELMLPLEAAHP